MKMKKLIMTLGVFGLLFTSCEKDDEILTDNFNETGEATTDLEVEKFIYKGMNDIYLYKADVPELGDSYFSSNTDKNDFLESFNSPEDLFDGIKYSEDRFSFLTDDYHALEESFRGVSSSITGMKYGVGKISGTNNVFGFLQYILPGTSAEEAGLERGTVFTEVDGQKMTVNNFASLLDKDSYTINIGKVEDGTIKMTDKTVTLKKTAYTTNPVYITETFVVDGKKIGYLMYNSFIGDFDDELNAAFADLKSEGITDLILDLRYNGGGSVESAVDLASMITGQFEGEVFMKEQWNEKYQEHLESENPERLINRFNSKIRTQETINSLKLSQVYVLTTGSSASASELVINGLAPYIDVVQVGETTTGKFQASVTLYDGTNFARENANDNHTYAIQPLVFKSANAAGKTDYVNGLAPDVKYTENLSNMGTLGDPSEPLLEAAINHMLGKPQKSKTAGEKRAEEKFSKIGESGMDELNYQRMYVDEIPAVLQEDID